MVSVCRRIVTSLMVAALLMCTQAANAQTLDESFRTDIEKLLEVTGSSQLGAQMASLVSRQVLDGLKQSQPDVPSRMIELAQQVLDEEFTRAFTGPDSLTSRIVPVYAKRLTQADVRGLLAFYGTDLGKKVVAALPIILQESVAVGQEWARQHMPEIIVTLERRLRSEGLPK